MNAREELIDAVRGNGIICANIEVGLNYESGGSYDRQYLLKVDHTPYELDLFLRSLDFGYNNGYGGQELFGVVWLEGGVWLERGGQIEAFRQ